MSGVPPEVEQVSGVGVEKVSGVGCQVSGWNRFAQSFLNRAFDTEAHDGHNTLLRHSLFDIRFFRVSSTIRLAVRGPRRRSYETTFISIWPG